VGNTCIIFAGGIMCMVIVQEILRQRPMISDAAHLFLRDGFGIGVLKREGDKKDRAGVMLQLMLLFFWLLAPTTAKRLQTICVFRDGSYYRPGGSYYRLGDLIIGGNLPLGTSFDSNGSHFNTLNLLLHNAERRVYPSFFQINPKESPQYVGLVQLLLHLQWNWVGLLAPEDDIGEHFISTLMPMLQEKEICLAFTERLKLDDIKITVKKFLLNFLIWSKTEAFILFGGFTVATSVLVAVISYENFKKVSFRKVWILTSHWKVSVEETQGVLQYMKFFHGALHFRDHSRDASEFSHFLLSLDPLNPQGDVFFPP
ncbi:hypothetical protein E2320_022156, partial [Naja naja]